jgi:AcrR family transcriptional regulator
MAAVLAGGTRNAILESATRLFGSQGYAGTTMRDIAGAVGVLPGSLYTHIDGKEALLREIVESGIDKVLALADATVEAGGSPEKQLNALIRGHVEIIAQDPDRTLVVFHQWRFLSGQELDRIIEKRRRYESVITTMVVEGMSSDFSDDLDRKVAVKSLLGALNWTAEWYRSDGPESATEIGTHLADTLILGLKRR